MARRIFGTIPGGGAVAILDCPDEADALVLRLRGQGTPFACAPDVNGFRVSVEAGQARNLAAALATVRRTANQTTTH